MLLEAEGFNVIGEAAGRRHRVRETARLRPELVLLDVQLPDIDGFDVAARIPADGGPARPCARLEPRPSDFGPLVARSGALGFVPKAELSGDRIHELL